MVLTHLIGFSAGQWFSDVCAEISKFFNTMNETQWMVISACAVLFGFLCLRGTNLKAS